MRIQVFGPGCAKCKQLEQNTRAAVQDLGLDVEVEKVEDVREMVKLRILSTPALAVDGQVKSTGKVLSVQEIKQYLSA
ncbi:MAG TPA: thioredoxin family protein [Armatimonadota bacterium]|nr:thioredoxin family protein [Armatimonadota bacterium]HQK95469.1 thioredoxin family protein [Armatimonadota bacterium]